MPHTPQEKANWFIKNGSKKLLIQWLKQHPEQWLVGVLYVFPGAELVSETDSSKPWTNWLVKYKK